jgi:hypothetical protein
MLPLIVAAQIAALASAAHPPPSSSQALAALQTNDGQSPIQKVVSLLKDMKAQTEKEAEEDQVAYDKYMCWCETVKKEKTAAIDEAQATITSLEAFVEEAAAKEGQLKTEISTLEDDIASDKESLASALALREKEAAEFKAEEADLKETLDLLGQAIGVLAKASELQLRKGHVTPAVKAALLQVSNVVKRFPQFQGVMQKDLFDLLGSTSNFMSRRNALNQEDGDADESSMDLPWIKTEEQKGIMAKPNALKGAAAGATSYSFKSGSILGMLKEMGDKSAKDLAAAQKADLEAMVSFQSLRAAKTAEIAAASKQKAQKEVELADLLDKVAKAKEDKESTEEALSADQQMLLQATKSCTTEEEEYVGRTKVRSEEIRALGEALNILTGDETRDLFSKTINFMQTSSIQVRSAAESAQANSAMQTIMAVAKKHKNWALATLAVHIRLDAFTKVKEAMDKMTAELKEQQKAEYEKKEFCGKKIDEAEDLIKVGTRTKEDLDGKHKDLSSTITTLKSSIAELRKEEHEAEVSLKSAGEDRKEANSLYQSSMSDQRATIHILQMALKRLKEFYTPKGAALVSVNQHSTQSQEPGAPLPPEPEKPADYEKRGGAGGVLQLLSMIISDAEATEAELKMGEQQAQQEYAAFVSATTASIEADRSAISEKEKHVADESSELSYTEESQLANDAEVSKLEELLGATHLDCDYVLKYFDVRQKARQEEIDAIAEAKAILSGADFS